MLTDEDKTFPHLENLRAIWAGGAGLLPAAWLVGGRVTGREEHEAGPPDLAELLELGVHPLAVRAWLLSTSYHKPLVASPEVLRMMGGNDANNAIAGKAAGSPEWGAAYRGKVEHFLRIAATAGVRILWVGLPAMWPGMSAGRAASPR